MSTERSGEQQICRECKHAESEHFSCEVGSFCKECSTKDNVWEHLFVPAHPSAESRRGERKIDGKFSMKYGVSGGQIVNTVSGEVIPEDEPLFLLRGRDNNAIACITSYMNICKKRGCNDLHLAGIQQTLDKFQAFANKHPERMKQPGITKHLQLERSVPAPAESRELDEEAERRKFEAWYEANATPLEADWFRRDSAGDYAFYDTQRTWEAWLAARRTAEKE